ncbi:MAG: hypothetical protein COV72_03755 [Candidatus Omnitrophica bacterium CG11_big_fil_rev_8_21_14_0_20_42_13]|uniref:PilZ domain-containing protein n=1 Tax=Candidatus Ghiorseimicrobium undicola TaxID=1974746 RepID=A0A2H0LY64_9BACT|nr:MAG: hypothetical protein COV72_03755 [Candidatus Omnitrophica bacterium CG11_big_fil_rev_8_21_14_0_20_42_13]
MEENIPLESSNEDRRIFQRRNFSSLLKFRLGKDGKDCEGVTKDISAGGLSFITKQRIKLRDSMELWITVPDGKDPIYKTAQLAWARENLADTYEAGAKFDSVGLLELSRVFKTLGR